MSQRHQCLVTCHSSTDWYRLMLLCEMNISSSVEWTSSSIISPLLTEDISSSFFTKETQSSENTFISPSITSLHYIISHTAELVSSHYRFTHTAPSQTSNPGHQTTQHSEIISSSNSIYDGHISTHKDTHFSLHQAIETTSMRNVANPSSMVTLLSGIRPSLSSTNEHITAQTASVNLGEITILDVGRATTMKANLSKTFASATIGQTTLGSGTSPSPSPTPKRTTPKKYCPCWCSSDKSGDSVQETATKAAKLSQLLQVQKGNLSKTINGKTSKDDKRVSARVLSTVLSLVILVMFLSLIILPDVLSVIICMSQRGQSDDLASACKK